jgi:hypothetical protein
MAPNSRHLIARLHNIDARQAVMMDTFPAVMRLCFPGVRYEVNKTDQYATLDNGAEIWFGGLDDKERVEKILGKEYATIYANEASQIAYKTILILRTRLAQKIARLDGGYLALRFLYDLNPTVKSHWSYREFVEGMHPDKDEKLPEGSRGFVQMNPHDNPHLLQESREELDALPERERTRFKDGQYLSEVPGALWTTEGIDGCRTDKHPQLKRIVVGVDPSGSTGTGGDSQGIIAVGEGVDGIGYVLEDGTLTASPSGWARAACQLYYRLGADKIVAESNFGGAMVESTIRGYDPDVNVELVTASRGKHVRAEPIAGLYEQGKVKHVGRFPELESQMTAFNTSGYQGGGSPDRADALVWALTELLLAKEKKKAGALW